MARTGVASITITDIADGLTVVGPQGAMHFYITGTAWNTTAADSATTDGGRVKQKYDRVTFSSANPVFTDTRYWTGSAWTTVTEVIDGALVVNGQAIIDNLAANYIDATKIDVGSLFAEEVTASGFVKWAEGANFAQLGGSFLFEAAGANGTAFSVNKEGEVVFDGRGVRQGTIGLNAISSDEIQRILSYSGQSAAATGGVQSLNIDLTNTGGTFTLPSIPHGSNAVTITLSGAYQKTFLNTDPTAEGVDGTVVIQENLNGTATWTTISTRTLGSTFTSYGTKTWAIKWDPSITLTRTPTATSTRYRVTFSAMTGLAGPATITFISSEAGSGASTAYAHNHDTEYYTESEIDTKLGLLLPKASPVLTGPLTVGSVINTPTNTDMDLQRAGVLYIGLEPNNTRFYKPTFSSSTYTIGNADTIVDQRTQTFSGALALTANHTYRGAYSRTTFNATGSNNTDSNRANPIGQDHLLTCTTPVYEARGLQVVTTASSDDMTLNSSVVKGAQIFARSWNRNSIGNLWGINAEADIRTLLGGTVTTAIGVKAAATINVAATADVPTAYASVHTFTNNAAVNVTTAHASYHYLDSNLGSITNGYAVRAYIDCDTSTIGTSYLFEGSYGTTAGITTRWGIKLSGTQINQIDGRFILTGTNAPDETLFVTGKTYLGGGSITSGSEAVLQVKGFQRTGSIYLHEGNSPASGTDKILANISGVLNWNSQALYGAGNPNIGAGATNYAAGNHTHDDRYFTETEANARFAYVGGTNVSGTWPIAVTGNAATATQFLTARTINGVSYNGTANITVYDSTRIPLTGGAVSSGSKQFYSTDIAGNYINAGIQLRETNLVGTAQSATGYAPALAFHWGGTNQSRLAMHADGRLHVTDGTAHATYKSIKALNFEGSVTGNASSATKLVTARTINGVSFDGQANITVYDATKLPLVGGALTGSVTTTGSFLADDPATTADWNANWKTGFYQASAGANAPSTSGWYWGLKSGHASNSATYRYGMDIVISNVGQLGTPYIRNTDVNGIGTWQKIWTDKNDSALGKLSAAQTWTGINTFTSTIEGTAKKVFVGVNTTNNSNYNVPWRGADGHLYEASDKFTFNPLYGNLTVSGNLASSALILGDETTTNGKIKFLSGTTVNDDAAIEYMGGNNAGFLRVSVGDDPQEYIEFGDYDGQDQSFTFTRWLHLIRGKSTFSGDVKLDTNKSLFFGNLDEGKIVHDGVDMYSICYTGNSIIRNWTQGKHVYLQTVGTSNSMQSPLIARSHPSGSYIDMYANSVQTFTNDGGTNLGKSYVTGAMSKIMTWADFTPQLNAPVGLENVITTNWLAAGAVTANIIGALQVNARHVLVNNLTSVDPVTGEFIVKDGINISLDPENAATPFEIYEIRNRNAITGALTEAPRPIFSITKILEDPDGLPDGQEIQGAVVNGRAGNKFVADINAVSDTVKKDINPYYLGSGYSTVLLNLPIANVTSVASYNTTSDTISGDFASDVSVAYAFNVSVSVSGASMETDFVAPSWKVEIFRGNLTTGVLILNKTHTGTASNVNLTSKLGYPYYNGNCNLNVDAVVVDKAVPAGTTTVYTVRLTRLHIGTSDTPLTITLTKFKGTNSAYLVNKMVNNVAGWHWDKDTGRYEEWGKQTIGSATTITFTNAFTNIHHVMFSSQSTNTGHQAVLTAAPTVTNFTVNTNGSHFVFWRASGYRATAP